MSAAGLSADYLNTNGDNIAQDHEIGLLNNAAIFAATEFAQADRRPEPDIERPWNLEWTGSIQHEIAPRVSITAAYYRRVFHDIEGTRNVLIQGCDPLTAQAGLGCGSWMPFNVTFDDPDGVLPSMVGTSFLAFNRDPATQGLTDRVDRTSDLMSNIYNGVEVSIQGRLPNGGTLFGGWTAHQHISNTCDLDNPNGIGIAEFIDINRNRIQGGRFCNQSEIGIPFRNDFKMFGAYPLPGDFEVSGSFQAYSGNEREVRWQIPASYYPGGQRTEARERPASRAGHRLLRVLDPGRHRDPEDLPDRRHRVLGSDGHLQPDEQQLGPVRQRHLRKRAVHADVGPPGTDDATGAAGEVVGGR